MLALLHRNIPLPLTGSEILPLNLLDALWVGDCQEMLLLA